MKSLISTTVFLLVTVPSIAAGPEAGRLPEWIWIGSANERSVNSFLRQSFEVDRKVARAHLRGIADFCRVTVQLNGQKIAQVDPYEPMITVSVDRHLSLGENVLSLTGASVHGPAAVAINLQIVFSDGTSRTIVTDSSWLGSPVEQVGWQQADFTPRGWSKPATFGRVGVPPWGDPSFGVQITPLDDYTQWKRALGTDAASDPAKFMVPDGFEIELLRTAGEGEDSWIGLTFDPRGRIIIGKEKKGLLRMTLPPVGGDSIRVESIGESLQESRGLLYAFESLYVNANKFGGLYRLRDTNGDDRFDEVKLLKPTKAESGGGHGRNDLVLGPDGHIYIIHGDAISVPEDAKRRTSPTRFSGPGDDLSNGHLIRTDSEGKSWEIICHGLRNPFGIDFDANGEMFTYDADAEHDMGSPWYRPTRVRHLVFGADYGWRRVTGRWPPYYPDRADNPPQNFDIGKGSPTAVKFGTKSRFPPKYQRALFILDWAYGRIIVVHMTPRGASYTCIAETFLRGRPLNVTQLEFGPDGAMYFVTGGRKTRSGLYRLRYVGPEMDAEPRTAQQSARAAHSREARGLRKKLASLGNSSDPLALETIWRYLDHPDPWIRYAARIALERQPPLEWQTHALSEPNPIVAVAALLALSRVGSDAVLPKVLGALNRILFAELPRKDKLVSLRTHEICQMRMGRPDSPLAAEIICRLELLHPDESAAVNRELAKLLVELQSPSATQKTLELLANAESQEDRLHYLLVLRSAKTGWTWEGRLHYFEALRQAQQFSGGRGMPSFLEQLKSDALTSLPESERAEFESILASEPSFEDSPVGRPFVRKWRSSDLQAALGSLNEGRDLDRGRALYSATMCIRCHRLGNMGRSFGPDLTAIASRFGRHDILESILSPSKVIDEKYKSILIITEAGNTISGQLVLQADYRSPVLKIATDPIVPNRISEVPKSEIASYRTLSVSPMPEGLLDTLTIDEILDLLAYLETGGESKNSEPPTE